MQIVTNSELIHRRARLGRIVFFLTLGALAGGFYLSLNATLHPEYIFYSYGLLLLGLMLAAVANYMAVRWVREPRPDQMLDQALKGLSKRYALFHYTLPASHVLVGPAGVKVLVVKFQPGRIRCQGNRWKQQERFGLLLRWMGREGLGNPSREVELETADLRRFLDQAAPDIKVSVQPIVVFTHPKAVLDLDECSLPALKAEELKTELRKQEKENSLSPVTINRLMEALTNAGSAAKE